MVYEQPDSLKPAAERFKLEMQDRQNVKRTSGGRRAPDRWPTPSCWKRCSVNEAIKTSATPRPSRSAPEPARLGAYRQARARASAAPGRRARASAGAVSPLRAGRGTRTQIGYRTARHASRRAGHGDAVAAGADISRATAARAAPRAARRGPEGAGQALPAVRRRRPRRAGLCGCEGHQGLAGRDPADGRRCAGPGAVRPEPGPTPKRRPITPALKTRFDVEIQGAACIGDTCGERSGALTAQSHNESRSRRGGRCCALQAVIRRNKAQASLYSSALRWL